MKATLTATDLFSSRGRVDVLRVLWGVDAPMTVAEIARRTRLTHPAADAALRYLANLRVVEGSPAGRGLVYWLNRDSVYVDLMIDPIFSAEREIPETLTEALQIELQDLAISAVLFGSYARGDQTPESDVDLVVVARDPAAKDALTAELPSLVATFKRVFGAHLSVIIYSREDAADLGKRAPKLYDSLWSEGVPIVGAGVEDWGCLVAG